MGIDVTMQVAAGEAVYLQISPSTFNNLRQTLDQALPYFAKYPPADIASGKWHRFFGHDPILDVFSTVYKHGPNEGIRHFGHIILTDFPTKDGIPIPGLSHTGFGDFLVAHGIPKGSLHFNVFETGIGILAVSEGNSDLIAALSGTMLMSTGTFFDTFVEGGGELALGICTGNFIMDAAGIENILAGVVSAWHTYSIYIDPFSFFGHALGGAIIGSMLPLVFKKEDNIALNTGRGALVSGLAAITPWFAYGAAAGFFAYKMGATMRGVHERSLKQSFYVDGASLSLVLESLKDDPHFLSVWESTELKLLDTTSVPLDDTAVLLDSTVESLDDAAVLLDSTVESLDDAAVLLDSTVVTLDDSQIIMNSPTVQK